MLGLWWAEGKVLNGLRAQAGQGEAIAWSPPQAMPVVPVAITSPLLLLPRHQHRQVKRRLCSVRGRVCSPFSNSFLTHSQIQQVEISKLYPLDTHRHTGMFHRANMESACEHRIVALTLLLHKHSQHSQKNLPMSHWPPRQYHSLVSGSYKDKIIPLLMLLHVYFPISYEKTFLTSGLQPEYQTKRQKCYQKAVTEHLQFSFIHHTLNEPWLWADLLQITVF